MAPGYNQQYGTYYDRVGSQSNQPPSGYSYQTSSTPSYPTTATSNTNSNANDYRSSVYQAYQPAPTSFGAQGYSSGAQQSSATTNTSDDRAAAVLSSLSTQNYGGSSSAATRTGSSQYDTSAWNAANSGYGSAAYNSANLQVPSRSTSNTSPLYSNNNTSTSNDYAAGSTTNYGETSRAQTSTPTYPAQSSNNTLQIAGSMNVANTNTSARSYSTTYTHSAQNPPPRYNSPHQAAQSAHSNTQTSTHQPSPRMAQRIASARQSASVEPTPAPATVDPSQVYDYRAEQQRKAQVEAEKRRMVEEAEKARKAEEDWVAAELKAENDRVAAKLKADEDTMKFEAEAARKKAENARMAEVAKKAREEKRHSKKAVIVLTQMASTETSSTTPLLTATNGAPEGPPADNEETEMREMFRKMREFNAQNPTMLAKLWEEERHKHATQASQPAQPPAPPIDSASSGTIQSDGTPSMRPFEKPKLPPVPKKQGKKQATKPTAAPTAAPRPTSSAPAVQLASQDTHGTVARQASSIWPPGKKGALANAAAKWLLSNPANASRTITKDDIMAKLDANPSYLELCESLERSGLVFDRAAFARALLSAVPDGMSNRSQPNQRPPQPNHSPAEIPTNSAQPQARETLTDHMSAAAHDQRLSTVAYETPANQGQPISLTSVARDLARRPSTTSQSPYFAADANGSQPIEVKPEVPAPRPPPANKEEAARKRTFNDLVDLTQGDSDDDGLPPPKIMRGIYIDVDAISSAQGAASSPNGARTSKIGDRYEVPSIMSAPGLDRVSSGRNTDLSGRDMSKSYLFQRPMQWPSQTQALPTHSSSPLTASPHAFGPASASVEEQRRLAGIPLGAQHAPIPREPAQATAEKLQLQRIHGQSLVAPIKRENVARKSRYDIRTIARDVLLATGRHPDTRCLNGHLNPMQGLLAHYSQAYDLSGNHADLTTIRWDLIDPGKPEPEAAGHTGNTTDDADDEGDAPARQATQPQRIDNGDGTVSFVHGSQMARGRELIIRKKQRRGPGRPPRRSASGNMQSLVGGPGSTEHAGSSGRQSLVGQASVRIPSRPVTTQTTLPPGSNQSPRTAGGPAAQSSSGQDLVGYSGFRKEVKNDENGKPINRQGRPVGWRKAIHSRAARGLTAAQGQGQRSSSGKKKRTTNSPEPIYQEYNCMWQDCGSKLHNLETLKKHVVKIHGRPALNGTFECLWEGCHVTAAEGDDSSKGKSNAAHGDVAEFDDIESWMEHMDAAHIQPVAFRLGDGPAAGIPDLHDNSDAYLSDAHGRSVTPVITPRSPGADTPRSRIMPAPLTGPSAGRLPKDPSSKDERDAAAELQRLEHRVRAVGPLLGRQGCRLASAKRRAGFLDDEDFEGEIAEDDVDVE